MAEFNLLNDPTKKTNRGLGFLPQGGAQAALGGAPLQSTPMNINDWWGGVNQHGENTLGVSGIGGTAGLPEAQGGWFDMKGKGGTALGVAQVGLGAYNAYNQEKQNDFMRSYYTNQMNLQKTDFMNAAKTTNNELAAREGRRLDASQGLAYDSAANQAGRADYMKNWGVKETF